jgi:peptidoglycan/LPS O-acetylase OafA/YrhL
MVVAFHAGLPVPRGFSGVDVFFVISGFVITGVLIRAYRRTRTLQLPTFYWRRFRRLTPALALLVAVTAVLSAFLQSPFGEQTATARTGIAAMLLVANVVIGRASGYFDPAAELNPLLNTWSLSVEEQFYLLLPPLALLALVVLRRRVNPRELALFATLLVTVISFSLAVATSLSISIPYLNFVPPFFNPLTRAWEFGVGALIAMAAGRFKMGQRASRFVVAFGLVLIAVAAFGLSDSTPFPGPWTLLPVLGASLVLAAGIGNHPTPLLCHPWLVALGDRSYAIYLWYWPWIVFAAAIWGASWTIGVLAAVASLAPAFLSYRFLEQPMRHWSPRSTLTAFVGSGLIICIPIFLSAALGYGAQAGWGQRVWIETRNALAQGHQACAQQECRRVTTASDVTDSATVVIGDSHAWHLLEAASIVAQARDEPLLDLSLPGCPLYDPSVLDPRLPAPASESCSRANETRIGELSRLPEGSLVIIGTGPGYWLDPRGASNLIEGLRASVKEVAAEGIQVALVAPIFEFNASKTPSPNPTLCSPVSMITGACPMTVRLEEIQGPSPKARKDLQALADMTGVTYVDLVDWQCPSGECGTRSDGALIYMDESHLSAEFSRLVGPWIRLALAT